MWSSYIGSTIQYETNSMLHQMVFKCIISCPISTFLNYIQISAHYIKPSSRRIPIFENHQFQQPNTAYPCGSHHADITHPLPYMPVAPSLSHHLWLSAIHTHFINTCTDHYASEWPVLIALDCLFFYIKYNREVAIMSFLWYGYTNIFWRFKRMSLLHYSTWQKEFTRSFCTDT